MSDVIADTLETVRQYLGAEAIGQTSWADIEAVIRQRWGGEGVYIKKNATDLAARDAAIRDEYRQGNIKAIMKKYRVSRSTVFRIVAER